MFRHFHHRLAHYLLLVGVWAVVTLPNLGAPSLWDIDEGHNAECAREMLDSGNLLVPTFNFQLRDHKPPLLYWLQIAAYERFGVNEFAARLPSALAALAAIILTYELGRLMFGKAGGFLAGLILASAAMFCAAGHFANPDSLLNALTVATFYAFWRSLPRSPDGPGSRLYAIWTAVAGVCIGLAVLTKGPVGLLLPLTVITLYLLWSRQFRLLLDHRLGWGVLAFVLIAVPWYAWITAETKGEFTRGFFLTHNFGRFLSPMENHRGPIYYYLIALLLGFAPWSPLLIPAVFFEFWGRKDKETRRQGDTETRRLERNEIPRALEMGKTSLDSPCLLGSLSPYLSKTNHPLAFLTIWILAYLAFFSLSGTKLPNYILPIYPAAAILTARFLNDWQGEILPVPRLAMQLSLAGVALVGLGFGLAALAAAGVINASALRGRVVPGLETWAVLGLIPIAGASLAAWLFRAEKKTGMVVSLAVSFVLFVSTIAAWGTLSVDPGKAPRPLVEDAAACQTDRDIRVGCYQFYQPSLVFYCRREVRILNNEDEALEFLRCPLPAYMFVSAQAWESLKDKISGPFHRLTHHRDIYKGIDVIVIANR
jgi:4-amino-4-deoxy-L-arabinose transferase-like glycosyltransferase